MNLSPRDVTACLVTRGNVSLDHQIKNMPFENIVVWDNSKSLDLRVFGRYEVVKHVNTGWVAWMDDDVEFDQWDALLAAAETNMFVSNNAHGRNHGGYDDLALQAAGAIIPTDLVAETWERWYSAYPMYDYQAIELPILREDRTPLSFLDGFLWECDFIFGVLCQSWKQIELPYTRLYADDNTRLCRQPWQEDLKLYMTNLAREIRDTR